MIPADVNRLNQTSLVLCLPDANTFEEHLIGKACDKCTGLVMMINPPNRSTVCKLPDSLEFYIRLEDKQSKRKSVKEEDLACIGPLASVFNCSYTLECGYRRSSKGFVDFQLHQCFFTPSALDTIPYAIKNWSKIKQTN